MRTRLGKTTHYQGQDYIVCEEVITFLLEYLSGELSDEEQNEFERHLGVCPSCVSYLKTYQETVKLGKAVAARPPSAPPEDLGSDLVKAILAARTG